MNNKSSELDEKPSAAIRAPKGPVRAAQANGKMKDETQTRLLPQQLSSRFRNGNSETTATVSKAMARSDSSRTTAVAQRIDPGGRLRNGSIPETGKSSQSLRSESSTVVPVAQRIDLGGRHRNSIEETAPSQLLARSDISSTTTTTATAVPQRNGSGGRLRNVNLSEKDPSSRLLTRSESSSKVASQRTVGEKKDEAREGSSQVAQQPRAYLRRSSQERLLARQQRAEGSVRLRASTGLDNSLHRTRPTAEPLSLAVPRTQQRRSSQDETMQMDQSLRRTISEKQRRDSGVQSVRASIGEKPRASSGPQADVARRPWRSNGLSSLRVSGPPRLDRTVSVESVAAPLQLNRAASEIVCATYVSPAPPNESFLTDWTHDAGESEQQNHIQPNEVASSPQDPGLSAITNDSIPDSFMTHPKTEMTESFSFGTGYNAGISEKEVDDELERQNVIWGHYERKKERDELRMQNRELLALLRAKEQEEKDKATTAEAEVQDTDQAVALALEMSLQDSKPKNDEDEGLSLAMELSRQESEMRENEEKSELNLVMELSRQEKQEQGSNGEEDDALNLVMELSKQETQGREHDPETGEEEALNLVMEISKRDTQGGSGNADTDLMRAMDLSRQEEVRRNTMDESLEMALRASLEDAMPAVAEDSEDAELLRVLELSRLE